METQTRKSVRLPDGKQVSISDAPEMWWVKDGSVGYVSPALLEPDPDQPRKDMNPSKLDELLESITERGVRQVVTVTPLSKAPWLELSRKNPRTFFLIVSGHRRWKCAMRANLPAIPIHVVCYESENEHRTDAGLLNACRDDLTELEEGFEFVRLRDNGATLESIRKAWGYKAQMQVYNRINLTKLHPDIQKLITPDTDGRKKFSITVAGILGGVKAPTLDELDMLVTNVASVVNVRDVTGRQLFDDASDDERRFAMQKIMVAVIQKRQLNAVRAGEFIRDHTVRFGQESGSSNHSSRSQRYQPARRKDILSNLLNEISGSVVTDWKPDEFRRIFELAPREEVEDTIRKLKDAGEIIAGIMRVLSGIRDAKRPTSPEVLKLIARK